MNIYVSTALCFPIAHSCKSPPPPRGAACVWCVVVSGVEFKLQAAVPPTAGESGAGGPRANTHCGGQTDRQAGRQTGRQAGRQAGRRCRTRLTSSSQNTRLYFNICYNSTACLLPEQVVAHLSSNETGYLPCVASVHRPVSVIASVNCISKPECVCVCVCVFLCPCVAPRH